MPSTSKKQHRFMAAVANNPKFAKQVGVKQSVGEDFMKADKGRKFAKGGLTRHEDEAMDKRMIKKAMGMHDNQMHGGKKTDMAKLKKGGNVFSGKETKAEEAKEKKMFGSAAAYKKAEAKYEGEKMKKGGKITAANYSKEYGKIYRKAVKTKKYEDGGLTFADMPEEERSAQARQAIADIDKRQAAMSEEAGGASTMRTTPRRAVKAAKPAVKTMSVTKEEVTGSTAAKPKAASRVSLEEYSARSPWNTRGTKALYGSEKATAETPAKKGALDDLMETFRKAPKLMKKGGSVNAGKRADGIAQRGKTKGRII